MASSVSGQDEPNPALWLVTRAGKMKPHLARSGLLAVSRKTISSHSLLTKFVRVNLIEYRAREKKNLAKSSRLDLDLTPDP